MMKNTLLVEHMDTKGMKVTTFQFVLVIGKYMQTWKLLNLEVFLVISFSFLFFVPLSFPLANT